MQTIISRQNFYSFVLAIAILGLLSMGLFLPLRPGGYPLDRWNMTYLAENEEVTLPETRMIQPGISVMTLTTTFPAVPGDTLVLPRVSGNAVEVFLNGELIYRLGDFQAPSTKLWNSQLLIMLPKPLQAQNRLEIRIASSAFGIGISAIPYLAPYARAARQVTLLDWTSNSLLLMTSGAAFIIGLMLLLSCYLRHQWNIPEFFIGLGLLCCVGFNQDAFYRATSGSLATFLRVTKGMMFCGYLAGLFLICGLEAYNQKHLKISRWAAGAVAVCGLALLVTPDLYWLTRVNQFGTSFIFVTMILACLLVFRASQNSWWLRLIAFLIALSILQMTYEIFFDTAMPVFLPYSISLSTLIIGVNSMLEYNRIINENRILRRTSNLDPLTGALNRRVLKEIDTNVYHFAVLIDINDFKELNDNHGHMLGDRILIEFTNVTRNNLRQDDLVIRWGGDEFLLVFANMPETSNSYQIVENIVQRISVQFGNVHPDLDLSFSYGIVMVQSPFERCLEEADRLMYNMKQVHRRKTTEKTGQDEERDHGIH
jgi:diguanylate cyclase (GGDEF)-like protein